MNVKFWKTAGIAAGIAVVTVVFLLAVIVFCLLDAKSPEKSLGMWVTLAAAAGGGVAGMAASLLYKDHSRWLSVVTGILYLVFCVLLTLPFGGEFSFTNLLWRALIPLLVCVFSGTALQKQGTNRFKNKRRATKYASKMYKRGI